MAKYGDFWIRLPQPVVDFGLRDAGQCEAGGGKCQKLAVCIAGWRANDTRSGKAYCRGHGLKFWKSRKPRVVDEDERDDLVCALGVDDEAADS